MGDGLLEFRETWDQSLAAEVMDKGWYSGASLRWSGRTIRFIFYDPVSLAQQVAFSLAHGEP